jgi:hypothetical protein
MVYDNNVGGEYAKNFVQELQEPGALATPEFKAMYQQFAKRILWLDSNVCEGAFQMNTAWYFAVPRGTPSSPSTCTTMTNSSASTAATRTTRTSWAA